MNYYFKYLKYKIKYLNLLGKQKRKLDSEPINTIEDKKSKTHINDIESIDDMESIDNIESIDNTIEISEKDKKLSTLFSIFISESLYQLSMKQYYPDNPEELCLKSVKENIVKHKYNLRNIDYKLKKENDDFLIGSYTPEIIKSLKSNGIDSTMIDNLVENFHEDDVASVNLLNQSSRLDPLYINYDNNGKNIECWVADNMYCPCCGSKSLRRYVKDNIPCIDLMCINPEHKFINGVKFFQVKAKSKYVTYQRDKNFDYELKQIHTGSKEIGQFIHDISKGEEYYGLLIGYICIEYEKIIREPNEIIKILNTSFITLPHIDITESKVLFTHSDKQFNNKLGLIKSIKPIRYYSLEQINRYYWYIDANPINNIIEFNTNNNDVIFFSSSNRNKLFGISFSMEFITTDYNPISTKWTVIPNPFVS
jgi:hypothetical protein